MVTTTIGVEGLDVRHGEHLLIADTPAALADACVELLRQPDRASAMAQRAHTLVRSAYGFEHAQEVIRRTVQAC